MENHKEIAISGYTEFEISKKNDATRHSFRFNKMVNIDKSVRSKKNHFAELDFKKYMKLRLHKMQLAILNTFILLIILSRNIEK